MDPNTEKLDKEVYGNGAICGIVERTRYGLPLDNISYSDNGLTVRAGGHTWATHKEWCKKATFNLATCTCGASDEVKRANGTYQK